MMMDMNRCVISTMKILTLSTMMINGVMATVVEVVPETAVKGILVLVVSGMVHYHHIIQLRNANGCTV